MPKMHHLSLSEASMQPRYDPQTDRSIEMPTTPQLSDSGYRLALACEGREEHRNLGASVCTATWAAISGMSKGLIGSGGSAIKSKIQSHRIVHNNSTRSRCFRTCRLQRKNHIPLYLNIFCSTRVRSRCRNNFERTRVKKTFVPASASCPDGEWHRHPTLASSP